MTDTRGGYAFPNTYAGSYVVRVPRPPGWGQTWPAADVGPLVVGYDAAPVTQDFGLASPPKKSVFATRPIRRSPWANPGVRDILE